MRTRALQPTVRIDPLVEAILLASCQDVRVGVGDGCEVNEEESIAHATALDRGGDFTTISGGYSSAVHCSFRRKQVTAPWPSFVVISFRNYSKLGLNDGVVRGGLHGYVPRLVGCRENSMVWRSVQSWPFLSRAF